MKGQRLSFAYVMSAKTSFMDKTRKNEIADLWHIWLSKVGYSKLRIIMKKSILKGLSKILARPYAIHVGCQCGKESFVVAGFKIYSQRTIRVNSLTCVSPCQETHC